MTYEYYCPDCDKVTDVVKGVKDFDRIEPCLKCGGTMKRVFRPKIHLYGTAVQDKYYSIATGQIVDNTRHERNIAKRMGMSEIGNENPRKHIKRRSQEY